MKVTIVNAMTESDASQHLITSLMEVINNYTIDIVVYHLDQVDLATCDFCLNCWIRHPERCKFDDDGRDIIDQLWSSDLLVYFTNIAREILPGAEGASVAANSDGNETAMGSDSPTYRLSESLERFLLRTIPYKRYPKLLVVGAYSYAGESVNLAADKSEEVSELVAGGRLGTGIEIADRPAGDDMPVTQVEEVREALAKRVERIRIDYHYRQAKHLLIHDGHNQIDRVFLLQEAFENII